MGMGSRSLWRQKSLMVPSSPTGAVPSRPSRRDPYFAFSFTVIFLLRLWVAFHCCIGPTTSLRWLITVPSTTTFAFLVRVGAPHPLSRSPLWVLSALSISNKEDNHNNSSMASSVARRAVGKLDPSKTLLLVCDMQERFRDVIHKMSTVLQTTQYMTSVASALDVPILATQQYTKVFGPTMTECFSPESTTSVESLQAANLVFEKKLFSMMTPQVQSKLQTDFADKTTFLLVGIETHVCVQQTCLDLLEQGKDVHVIVDGVSSQQPIDRTVAIQRMQSAGAFVTTAQSAAFMLMQSAEHPNFKTVSKLTVEHMKLTNEFNT